jgi:hypothetical protein
MTLKTCVYIYKTELKILLSLRTLWRIFRRRINLKILSVNVSHAGRRWGKVVPVLNKLSTMPREHMREWKYSSTILDPGTGWRWVVSFTPLSLYSWGKSPPVPIEWEAGWVPKPDWTLWRREKSCPCRESNTGRPSCSPSLYRLSYSDSVNCLMLHSSLVRLSEVLNLKMVSLSAVLCFQVLLQSVLLISLGYSPLQLCLSFSSVM